MSISKSQVEGKAPENSLPLTVEAWTRFGKKNCSLSKKSYSIGEGDLDLDTGRPLVLLAKVVQGNQPVIGASVTALVNRFI